METVHGHTNFNSSSVGIVKEDLEVLVEMSGVLGHLLLQQLEQAVEGYLTEQVVGFLCKKNTVFQYEHTHTRAAHQCQNW